MAPKNVRYLLFLPSVGNLKEACQAVASYLLFYPDDEVMLDNMKYYRSLPKVTNDYFTPREVGTQASTTNL